MSPKCALGVHGWDGCICPACRKVRNEQHNWSQNCERCVRCGKERADAHDWSQDCEKCAQCGQERSNAHFWADASVQSFLAREGKSSDCEKCLRCGKERINGHTWEGCKCRRCEKVRNEQHDWNRNCERCAKCGKERTNAHDWSKDCEKCSQCTMERYSMHKWSIDNCLICGKVRDIECAMIEAARCGDLKTLKSLRGDGENLHFTYLFDNGRTLLHHAADSQQEAVVRYLLSIGLQSKQKDYSGQAASAYAYKGDKSLYIMRLLENPPNAPAPKGFEYIEQLSNCYGTGTDIGKFLMEFGDADTALELAERLSYMCSMNGVRQRDAIITGCRVLRAIGDERVVKHLLEISAKGRAFSHEIALAADIALDRFSDSVVSPYLMEIVCGKDDPHCSAALLLVVVERLEKRGIKASADAITALLKHTSSMIVIAAARTLKQFRYKEAVPALIAVLEEDPASLAKDSIVDALGTIGDSRALCVLAKLQAWEALGSFGDLAIPFLVAAAEKGHVRLFRNALMLGWTGISAEQRAALEAEELRQQEYDKIMNEW